MTPSLIALAGPMHGEVLQLLDTGLTFGRDASNDLHPADLSLSRRHCAFMVDDDRVTITDLDSMNGTFVNGVPVKAKALEHGDQVKIGESVFLFLQRETAPAVFTATTNEPVALATATVQLKREDVLYLQSEQMLDVFPPALRQAHTLERLLCFSRAVALATNADAVYRALFDGLLDLIPAEHVAILWSDVGEPDLEAARQRSRRGDPPLPVSRTIVGRVLADGVALLSGDAAQDDRLREAQSVVTTGTQSVLCAPIMRSGRPEGVLYLTSGGSAEFGTQHLHLVTAVGGVAALAFGNVRQIEMLERDLSALRAELEIDRSLVGESAVMRDVYGLITKAARADSTVLIVGDSGTGKELAARDIHRHSPRARKPFVVINVSELAEPLLESELFGHEKGAFTGAIAQKKGKLELAEGGTIFLDEIGELASSVQVKLLRVLQEREFTRVGSTRPIRIDVRFIAATNRNLEAAVKSGAFRQDLFYRLNVVTLRMPPLRERPEDIPLLAAMFVKHSAERCKRHVVGVSPEARAYLTRYTWPGNVRELQNAIERAVVLGCADRITPEDLPETVLEAGDLRGEGPTNYHEALQAAKKRIVLEALERAGGQHAEAAKELGIHPNNLHRLIRHLRLRNISTK
jgi:transcriptional regulator with GAF, ATPase, and Fis domain